MRAAEVRLQLTMPKPGAGRGLAGGRWGRAAVLYCFVLWTGGLQSGTAAAKRQWRSGFRGSYWRDRKHAGAQSDGRSAPTDIKRRIGHWRVWPGCDHVCVGGSWATTDQPFTELRHEIGFGPKFPWQIDAFRRVRLFDRERLAAYCVAADQNQPAARQHHFAHRGRLHALVGGQKRLRPTGYLNMGILHEAHAIVGFASDESDDCWLAQLRAVCAVGLPNNPYRPVFVAGEQREFENLPRLRIRHAIGMSGHKMFRFDRTLVPHLTLRPALRILVRSGITKSQPRACGSFADRPRRAAGLLSYFIRPKRRFIAQAARRATKVFPGAPCYTERGVEFGTATDSNGNGRRLWPIPRTPKLGTYSTWTTELQIKWRMTVFSTWAPSVRFCLAAPSSCPVECGLRRTRSATSLAFRWSATTKLASPVVPLSVAPVLPHLVYTFRCNHREEKPTNPTRSGFVKQPITLVVNGEKHDTLYAQPDAAEVLRENLQAYRHQARLRAG